LGHFDGMDNNGRAEATATGGLFLVFVAIIAAALCLASWGAAEGALAIAAGVVALTSFIGSLTCFAAQADEPAPQELAAVQ
jgi:hypothetical protein